MRLDPHQTLDRHAALCRWNKCFAIFPAQWPHDLDSLMRDAHLPAVWASEEGQRGQIDI